VGVDMIQALVRSLPFAALFLAALYLLTRTLQFDFPRAPGRLGPDVWPQAILVLLMIACTVGIARSILAKGPEPSGRAEEGGTTAAPGRQAEPEAVEVPPRYALAAGGLVLFLVYPVALEYLGFPLATVLLMVLFMLLGGWRNLPGVAAVSIAGTLVLFYVFRGIVYVSLPLGRGPFHAATEWVASLLRMY
jgi:hypothetical protein